MATDQPTGKDLITCYQFGIACTQNTGTVYAIVYPLSPSSSPHPSLSLLLYITIAQESTSFCLCNVIHGSHSLQMPRQYSQEIASCSHS